MARVFDLAVQLAVREQARPAFAELHVAFGVSCACATGPRCPWCAGAPAGRASSTMGLEPHLGQASAANRPHGPMPISPGAAAGCQDRRPWRPSGQPAGAVTGGTQRMSGVGPMCGWPAWRCGRSASWAGSASVTSINEHGQQIGLARIEAALEHYAHWPARPQPRPAPGGQAAQGRQRMDTGRVQGPARVGCSASTARRSTTGRADRGSLSSVQADRAAALLPCGGLW